mmetsp:Transcript_98354/g.174311  ORF Transcript_98354/g.174311 Transcript_98354/m.174311 type:complete len:150 (+) Transcript_98354:100-549(+)
MVKLRVPELEQLSQQAFDWPNQGGDSHRFRFQPKAEEVHRHILALQKWTDHASDADPLTPDALASAVRRVQDGVTATVAEIRQKRTQKMEASTKHPPNSTGPALKVAGFAASDVSSLMSSVDTALCLKALPLPFVAQRHTNRDLGAAFM